MDCAGCAAHVFPCAAYRGSRRGFFGRFRNETGSTIAMTGIWSFFVRRAFERSGGAKTP